jgi:hypothetical protein
LNMFFSFCYTEWHFTNVSHSFHHPWPWYTMAFISIYGDSWRNTCSCILRIQKTQIFIELWRVTVSSTTFSIKFTIDVALRHFSWWLRVLVYTWRGILPSWTRDKKLREHV